MHPALMVGSDAAAWDHIVDVRVMQELLTPGVQNTEEPQLGAQISAVARASEPHLGQWRLRQEL